MNALNASHAPYSPGMRSVGHHDPFPSKRVLESATPSPIRRDGTEQAKHANPGCPGIRVSELYPVKASQGIVP